MWSGQHLPGGRASRLGGNFQNWVRLEITGGTSYVIRGKISENI